MTEEKKEKQGRIWPWVLIASVLLLVLIATLLSVAHAKPMIELRYDGYASPDFEGEFVAMLWATNPSSRTVVLRVKCIETNILGQWYSSTSATDTLSMQWHPHVLPPHDQRRFSLSPPSGVDVWRARFIMLTEVKGWEVYWWYVKACGKHLLHGRPLPQFPKSPFRVLITDSGAEIIGPVVSSK